MHLSELKGLVKGRIRDLQNQHNVLPREQQCLLGDIFEGRLYELRYIMDCLNNKPHKTVWRKGERKKHFFLMNKEDV